MRGARLVLLIAAALVLPSCNDEPGPTAPDPTPLLGGTWQGTVRFDPVVRFYYDDQPVCPDQPVTVVFRQQEQTFDGTIEADCVTAQFQGRIESGHGLRGKATQGIYAASLAGSFAGFPVSEVVLDIGSFTNPTGSQRGGIHLRLHR
jgi:hypothetical protein